MKTLRKALLFIALLFIGMQVYSQSPTEYFITAIERLETYNEIVIDGDTFTATTQVSNADIKLATEQYVLQQAGAGNGWDSLTYSDDNLYMIWWYSGVKLDSLYRGGVFINVSDSTGNEQYNYVNHRQLDSAVAQSGEQVNFWFILPANASLALSAQNVIGLPTGWSLSVSGPNLIVTHNLNRAMMTVGISNSTTISYPWRQYRTFGEGYSGLLNTDADNFTIEGITTEYISFNLRVQISFEQ